ncbi:stress-responsive transcriptional regulator [Sphingomonas oleivorans]|uniref:Stress-responsive transcriptional regulator n=1 Tax=Sphingomonas oleivorans TaxID=1735121 RepID=A0A2T5G2U9_9SPHN|nr:PspC domain-containing protein [Sphingomonas oleivorans]PTQ13473.1 stress-responsive transcriptional regulator [Sphingomonas oleivorans]
MSAKQFRLNKSDARLMGVCAGIGDYTGLDPLIVRLVTVLLTLCAFGPAMLLAYLIIGLIATDRPR